MTTQETVETQVEIGVVTSPGKENYVNTNNSNPQLNMKVRSESTAVETLKQSKEDAKRSKWCNAAGNILTGILLLAYFIYAWVEYANTKTNRQTIVTFTPATTLKFPTIFFQSTEYGSLRDANVTIYKQNCDISQKKNGVNSTLKVLTNPTITEIKAHNTQWLLVNASLQFLNYSGYGCDYNSSSSGRRLFDFYDGYYNNSYYYDYTNYDFSYSFTNYSAASYCSSSTSNIFFIIPPQANEVTIDTNQHSQCGDVFELKLVVTVPYLAFKTANLTNLTSFYELLYVRSYPDSFGFLYGFDSEDVVLDSYSNSEHIYFSGRLPYGEMRSEQLQLIIADDQVDGTYFEYYESGATVDYSNVQNNATYRKGKDVFFISYLYVYGDDFLVDYKTIQQNTWYDVISGIGGMYGTISGPIAIFLAAWLYGFSIGCIKFDGIAPLDPLPDDMVKRLDGYLAKAIDKGVIAGGAKASQLVKEDEVVSNE